MENGESEGMVTEKIYLKYFRLLGAATVPHYSYRNRKITQREQRIERERDQVSQCFTQHLLVSDFPGDWNITQLRYFEKLVPYEHFEIRTSMKHNIHREN